MFTVTAIQLINYLPDDVIKYTVAALHIINPVTNVDSIQASLVTWEFKGTMTVSCVVFEVTRVFFILSVTKRKFMNSVEIIWMNKYFLNLILERKWQINRHCKSFLVWTISNYKTFKFSQYLKMLSRIEIFVQKVFRRRDNNKQPTHGNFLLCRTIVPSL